MVTNTLTLRLIKKTGINAFSRFSINVRQGNHPRADRGQPA